MKTENNQLKSWLFNKPILFTAVFLGLGLISSVIYSLLATFIQFETATVFTIMFILSFVYSVYYMIKKLPHDKMYRNDLVAIVNGGAIISILSSLCLLFVPHTQNIEEAALKMYVLHPTMFTIGVIVLILFGLYLIGLAFSGIYAKYKRCIEMGISPWKIILSMPFAFFLLWTPGYLIGEKTKKSNLKIKSQWYTKLNNWILKNFNNTLFVFLLILLFKTCFSGIPTMILTVALLILYTLWYVKHKSDFIKNINSGYALTAVGINVAIVIAVLLQYI